MHGGGGLFGGGGNIPYNTASNKRSCFPAARVTMELEGKKMNIAVGVSKHLSEEMLMGRDIPHFRQYIRKELEKELKKPTLPGPVTNEMSMAVTHAQLIRQTALEEEERLRQERDGAITTELHLVEGGMQTKAKELRVEKDLAEALGRARWRSRNLKDLRERTS